MMVLLKKYILILAIQLVVSNCWSMNAQTGCSEVAFLQTDRTSYVAGETMFFKLYVIDMVTKKPSDISKVGYILLRSTNLNPIIKIRVKIDDGMARGSFILPDTLTSGVYQILAFTSLMKNQGEGQVFFHKEIVISNIFDKELDFKHIISTSSTIRQSKRPFEVPKITTDKSDYGTREKVKVSLGKTNSKANVAVTVYEESTRLSTDKSIVEILDELPDVSIIKKVSSDYLPERTGKILKGRVIDETTQKSVQAVTVLLSCVDTVPNMQYASTNSDGVFHLLLNDYYNGKELFLTIKDKPADRHWKIEIDDEFNLSKIWNPALFPITDDSKEFILKSQNIVYINKAYHSDNEVIEVPKMEMKSICPQLYHCPVKTVLLSNFESLNDFPEIVLELFPLIRIEKQKDNYHIRIVGISSYLYGDTGPAIFLDGVFIDDVNKIMGLGSEKIKKIDVIYAERTFGDLVFQGVISITSKTNEIIHTKPAPHSIRFKNDNFNSTKSFIPVNQNSIQNKNTPLFKQLLFWNPDLELNGIDNTNFEFFTTDNASKFVIKVEGISEDGTPISASSSIQVNDQLKSSDK